MLNRRGRGGRGGGGGDEGWEGNSSSMDGASVAIHKLGLRIFPVCVILGNYLGIFEIVVGAAVLVGQIKVGVEIAKPRANSLEPAGDQSEWRCLTVGIFLSKTTTFDPRIQLQLQLQQLHGQSDVDQGYLLISRRDCVHLRANWFCKSGSKSNTLNWGP